MISLWVADCSSSANAGTALAAICQGGTSAALGGSLVGTATGGTWTDGGVGGTFNPGATTLNATWTPPAAYFGTATLTLTPTGGLCAPSTAASKTIVVNGDATIVLTSATGTTSQTICINKPLTAITYLLGGGATGATLSGQPLGITGSYNSGTKIYTISGSPTVSGGPFNYTITTTGPCVKPFLTGTITVNPNSTIALSSASGSDAQTICQNTPLTTITYVIGGGGTGASITAGALPAGVTGVYNNGVFTISGTPTSSGNFSYTVTTSGPCVNPSLSGTISVSAQPTGTFTSSSSKICAGQSVTFTFLPAGLGSYTFRLNGVGAPLQSNTSNTYSTSALNNGDFITVDVANAANCGATFTSAQIIVNLLPNAVLTASPAATTICAGDPVTFTGAPAGAQNYNFRIDGVSGQSGTSNSFTTNLITNNQADYFRSDRCKWMRWFNCTGYLYSKSFAKWYSYGEYANYCLC